MYGGVHALTTGRFQPTEHVLWELGHTRMPKAEAGIRKVVAEIDAGTNELIVCRDGIFDLAPELRRALDENYVRHREAPGDTLYRRKSAP
jgi:hypothetical protein